MTLETLQRVIDITEADTISINGLGEPLMNPLIYKMIEMLTKAGIKTLMNSNGKMVTQESYNLLAGAGLTRLIVTSDYFKWNKQISEISCLKIEHIVVDSEVQFEGQIKKELYDWAGRVGDAKNEKVECSYIKDDWTQVMWDGRIVRCCQDFNTEEPLGHIDDNIHTYTGIGIRSCANCQGFKFTSALVVGNYQDL
jgi:organic radical activating enzyme